MNKMLLLLSLAFVVGCDQGVSAPKTAPASSTGQSKDAATVTATETGKKDGTPTQPVSVASKGDDEQKEKQGNKVEKDKPGEEPEKVGRMELSEEEWRNKLSPEEYYILRQKGTERAFTGKYDKFYKPGRYLCAGCGLELFTSSTKFDSGCGWPAFYAAKAGDRVKLIKDLSAGMVRTEVVCARCDGHLGHVFENEGYPKDLVPTGQRFCINSVSIKFVPADESKGVKREDAAKPESKE